MEIALKRLSYGLAWELAPYGVTALSITPGFMRTEAILESFGVTEANWRDALDRPNAKAYGWGGSETPCFVGRALAALAADPDLVKKSGGIYNAWELSKEYGFTDVDGTKPDWAVLQEASRKSFAATKMHPAFEWQLART